MVRDPENINFCSPESGGVKLGLLTLETPESVTVIDKSQSLLRPQRIVQNCVRSQWHLEQLLYAGYCTWNPLRRWDGATIKNEQFYT